MFTELVGRLPLVTENTIIRQLYSITKLLGCNNHNLTSINKYLYKHGIEINLENQQKQPSHKSYTIYNTAKILRNVYPTWPTHLFEIVAHCLQLSLTDRSSASQLLNLEFFTTGTFMSNFDKTLENKLKYEHALQNINT